MTQRYIEAGSFKVWDLTSRGMEIVERLPRSFLAVSFRVGAGARLLSRAIDCWQ